MRSCPLQGCSCTRSDVMSQLLLYVCVITACTKVCCEKELLLCQPCDSTIPKDNCELFIADISTISIEKQHGPTALLIPSLLRHVVVCLHWSWFATLQKLLYLDG